MGRISGFAIDLRRCPYDTGRFSESGPAENCLKSDTFVPQPHHLGTLKIRRLASSVRITQMLMRAGVRERSERKKFSRPLLGGPEKVKS